jgi:drug/metabolite transporter (DMT)-like permease
VAAVPIAGALLARATGTDRLDRRRLAGLGLGVVGAGALVGFDVGRSSALAASSFLLVITGYALGPWILARYLSGVASGSVILASLVLCALAYTPAAVIQRPRHSLSTSVVLSMTGLAVVCTALAFTLFFALIKEVGPMRATVITYLNPAVAVLLGVTVLGESFGVATVVGFVAVLGGSFLATRSLRPPVPAPSPSALPPEPSGPRPGASTLPPEPSGTRPGASALPPELSGTRPGPSAGIDVAGTTGQALGATVSGAWERPPNLD